MTFRYKFFRPSGFSLIEVMAAMFVMSIGLPAVTYMLASGLAVGSDVNRDAQAYFLANALMNEISRRRFWEAASSPGNDVDSGETSGFDRTNFDDIDDYNIFKKTWGKLTPPRDETGTMLTDYAMFSQYVTVVNVAPPGIAGQARSLAALADGSTDFKLVTVTISWNRSNHVLTKIFARP